VPDDFIPISYASTDGLALHARDYPPQAGIVPARLPVVCLHGLTRNASDFHAFAPRAAAMGRRVLAPDMRGRGRSAWAADPADYNLQVYAADVATLLSGQDISQAIFVGTSLGGLITMTLVDAQPDLVAAVVLNDIGPTVSEQGLARIAGYAGRPAVAACWEEAAAYVRDINACAFPDYRDHDWSEWARRAFQPDATGRLVMRYDPAIGLALEDGKRKTTTPELQRAFLRMAHERPTLLVRGALSDLLEPRHALAMRLQAPAMRYVEVPGVGHAPMLTEPAAFDAIADFLAALP
jgi:pimeloyl-ACP methyl ester carboxylesterase